jgi:hypothetical protein
MEAAYYTSDEWRRDPREAMLALMENYTGIVFELDQVKEANQTWFWREHEWPIMFL